MGDADTIVIGSGIGGLAAAVALARAGERVLVLEQHYLPGGWCHSFSLEGFRFSPGVHYIGELEPGGLVRGLLDGLGVSGDLAFRELNPDGMEHVIVGDERLDLPRGRERLAAVLKARFPAEARGIDRYLGLVARTHAELQELMALGSVGDLLALPFRARTVLRHGYRSLASVVASCVEDPLLRAVLTVQWGDHGVGPSRVPFVQHAAVAAHYFDGGWYPKGGAAALPKAFIKELRRRGGDLRVRAEVQRILVEGGRVAGVRLADGTELRARRVVSNADPGVTYGRLLAPEDVPARLRRRLARTRWSVSALSLFMAADMDARAEGYDSGNYWYARTPDVEAMYRYATRPDLPADEEPPGCFVTFTTLKDPGKRRDGLHTLEAFTFVSHRAFEAWAGSHHDARPAAYLAYKDRLEEQLLRSVERVVPGLRERLVFKAFGTPLTNDFYVMGTGGSAYGTEKDRWQIGPFAYNQKAPVPGLWLCGASTLGHGVAGAMMSGVVAAARALGVRPPELLTPEAGMAPTLLPAEPPAADDGAEPLAATG